MSRIAMFLCVAAMAGSAMADTSTTLVGGSLLNGDFNNPASDANFQQLASWVNIGTGAATLNATKISDPYDSTHYAIVGFQPSVKVFGLDTGHPLAEGDILDIAYIWKDGYLWSDASDQIRVSLFVTDDNTIGGARTDLVTDLSGLSTANSTYEAVNHTGIYVASAADAGKTLFVAIDTTIVDESYAQLDNFELVVRTDTTPPAAPAVPSVAAGDGYVFINWPPNSEPDLTGYSIYRSTSPGVYAAPLATGLTASEFLDETVLNGTTYYYVVKAVDEGNNESAASQEAFAKPKNYVIYSTKKGVGNNSNNKPLQKVRVESLNASWYYSWSMDRNFDVDASIEYVPMRHNRWWPNLTELADCGTFNHLLAFNEPEQVDQANITVQQALDQWPALEAAADQYGALLSSPAPSGVTDPWLTNFMVQAESLQYRVDFIAFHKYPNPDQLFTQLKNECNWAWAEYGKPIWVTEFNGADWSQTGSWSMADTYTTMIELLYYFENTPYVERYAVFPWDIRSPAGVPSPVFEVEIDAGVATNATATLTPLGSLYAQYRNDDVNGPYTQTWYYLHNKDSKKRLRDNAGVPATVNIFNENESVEFQLVDAGSGKYYIVNRALGKRLGYNGSSLFWAVSAVGDSTVQWNITNSTDGWDYINHVGSGKRLSGSPLGMVAGGSTSASVQWSFVRTPSEYDVGPYVVWAADALAGIAYSTDLSGSAPAEIGGSGSFSMISGPAWLNMETNGVVLGTPASGDAGTNDWQFTVTDGVNTATGTLYIAVQNKTIVYWEDFSTLTDVPTASPSVFPAPQLITTVASNGYWYKGGTVVLDGGTLKFVRVAAAGGLSASAIVFAEARFAAGAGTYTLSFDVVSAGAVNKTYLELHDLDLTVGTVSVPTYKWAKFFEDPDGTLPDIAPTDGASASLITNVTYGAGVLGVQKIEFEYDGSGDVLLRIGAGKNDSTDWWTDHRIDNLLITGSVPANAYDVWASSYGLSGADAAATNDYDGDLWNNLLEYALGGNPTNGLDKGHPQSWGQGVGNMVYVYPRRKASDLSYWLETSTNLVSNVWTNSGYAVSGTGTIDAEFDAVTNTVPMADDQGYVRLRIE